MLKRFQKAFLLAVSTAVIVMALVFAIAKGGSLTPPAGPIGSTMRSLQEIYNSLAGSSVNFTGSGLNDMALGGIFIGGTSLNYRVQIDAAGTPDTFEWSDDGGVTWDAAAVAITGLAQTLNNGVTITFGATAGHTAGNRWDFYRQVASINGNIIEQLKYISGNLFWTRLGNDITNANSGNVGIGIAPSAYLTIKAGTIAAGTAPLKFISGNNLTAPEAGALEFNGNHLYFTDATPARFQLAELNTVADAKLCTYDLATGHVNCDTDSASVGHSPLIIGAVGVSPNANGMTLAPGQILNLEPADAANPGAVTTGSQTFAGDKTFNGNTTLAADKSLKITGGITFPTSPTEGQIFFRTDTKQLYVYANAKWQADRSTATLIVAASDSQNKEKADYVADGTNDQAEINAAITALPAGGGLVYLLDGNYNIGTAVDITKSNVTLMGTGNSTKLFLVNGANTDVIVLGDGVSFYSNIYIINLQIDGNDANQTAAGLQGIEFKDNITESRIEGNYIHNNRLAGIKIPSTSNYNKIINNYINNNNVAGGSGSGGIDLAGDYNIISGNKFSSNSLGDIPLALADYNVIDSNTFISSYVAIGNSGSGGVGTVISNNTFDTCTIDCIELWDTRFVISGNTIKSAGQRGIEFGGSDSNISNNVIYEVGATYDGIYIYGDNNIVSSNRIYDSSGSQYGINLAAGGDNNQILGNEISGAGFTSKVNDAGSGNTIQQRDQFEIEQTNASASFTALTVTQSGTGNIIEIKDDATAVFTISDGGNITVAGNISITGDIKASGGILYDAIVSLTVSKGQYTSIQSAINDGKKRIFVKNGTYLTTADIVVPDGAVIIGESKEGVIIDFASYDTDTATFTQGLATVAVADTAGWAAGDYIKNNSVGKYYKILTVDSGIQVTLTENYREATAAGAAATIRMPEAYQIIAQGDTGAYVDGTLAITNGQRNVTGTATAWLANASAGEYILLGQQWYKIASIISNTSLTIEDFYLGLTLSGASYRIAAFKEKIMIENIQAINSSDLYGAIYFLYVKDSAIRNVIANNNLYYGIYLNYSHYNYVLDSEADNNGNSGIILDYYSDNNTISGNEANNNTGRGILLYAYNTNNNIIKNKTSNNIQGIGVIQTANNYNTISSNICSNNTDGIYIANSSYNTVSANECNNNSRGVFLEVGANFNMVAQQICSNNAFSGIVIEDNADNNTISSSVCKGNADYGVKINTSDVDYTSIVDSTLSGNTSGAIYDSGTNTQRSGNYTGAAGEGLFHTQANSVSTALTVTQSGTGKIADLIGNSITTGTGLALTANGLTTGTGFDISSSSTAGGASSASKLLNLSRSGANANTAHTAYGVYSSVINTNATSGTNIAGYFSASGATTANYGLIVENGNVGIGTTTPGSKLDILQNSVSTALAVRQDGDGKILSLNDGVNNEVLAVSETGQTTLKPAAFDAVYNFDGAAYTDNIAEAKTSGGTAFTMLSAEASSDDVFYLGLDHPFNTAYFNIATAGAGVTLSAQYYRAILNNWFFLSITDNTSNLTTSGTITFTAPSNWIPTTVNGVSKYWIRLISSATNITTAPTAYSVSPTSGNRFYAYAQSGDTNPALYINDKGNIGINTSSPARNLEVLNASNPQMRLTYDASNRTEFQVGGTGVLTITTAGSGTDIIVYDDNFQVCASGCPAITMIGTGNIQVEGDIYAAGGYKNSFNFAQSNSAASQTAVAIDVLGLAGNTEYVLPYTGSIIGISVASNDARTAGTLTVDATVNGTVSGLQAVLNVTNTTYHSAAQGVNTDTFSAGDRLGVKITTDGSWAPTTADIVVTVIIEY